MNAIRSPGTALGIIGLFAFMLSGCYMQLETSRYDRYGEEDSYVEADTTAEDSSGSETAINNYYNDGYGYGWYPGYRIGFSYYYPYWYWPS